MTGSRSAFSTWTYYNSMDIFQHQQCNHRHFENRFYYPNRGWYTVYKYHYLVIYLHNFGLLCARRRETIAALRFQRNMPNAAVQVRFSFRCPWSPQRLTPTVHSMSLTSSQTRCVGYAFDISRVPLTLYRVVVLDVPDTPRVTMCDPRSAVGRSARQNGPG